MSLLYVHNDDIINNTGIVLSNPTGNVGTYELKLEFNDWNYRKSFSISHPSGQITNYQMKILVGESSGATGEDVDCGGKCKTDFSDLRFTTSDGTTLLGYWIENITGTTPNQLATIWVQFDSIGTTDTTFYMYYGNSDAPPYSNPIDTFIFADDFEYGVSGDDIKDDWTKGTYTGKISTDKHASGTRSVKLVGVRGNYPVFSRQVDIDINTLISFKVNHTSFFMTYFVGNTGKQIHIYFNWGFLGYYNGSYIALTYPTQNTWYTINLYNINFSNGTCTINVPEYNLTKNITMATTTSGQPTAISFHGSNSASYTVWYDDIFIKKWVQTEPVIGNYEEETTLHPSLSWGSGTPTEVTQDGIYTLSDGSNTIDATIDYSELSTETTIDNVRVVLTVSGSIILQSLPNIQIVKVGSSQQYLLSIVSSGGIIEDYITSDVTWASSNENIATVSSSGLVYAVSLGNVTISATYMGVTLSIGIKTARDIRTIPTEPDRLSPHPYTYTATLGVSSRTGVK